MDVRVADPVTVIAHELRRPLAYVATAARLVAEETGDEAARERCQTIERTAERMLRVAGCLLEAAGGLVGDDTEGEYRPADVVRTMAEGMRELRAPIRLVIADDATDALAWGRPNVLEALVHSLLSNALDHGVPGEPPRVVVALAGGAVRISICNRTATERSHQGFGLGTLICRQLAERCDAEIETCEDTESYTATVSLKLLNPLPAARIQYRVQWRPSDHPIPSAVASA